MLSHKLTIKGKFYKSLTKDEAQKILKQLLNDDLKFRYFDIEKGYFSSFYKNDIVLSELTEIEKVVENTSISNYEKKEVYKVIGLREEENKRINGLIIQNIIDETLKLDLSIYD